MLPALLATLLPPTVEAAPPLVSPSGAGTVVIGPQAMEGNLQIHPGDPLRAGFDFTMPGSHPAATASFYNGYVSLLVKCADGSTPPLTIQLPSQTITDPAGSPSWYPSGDQSSSLVYQGTLTAPDLCAGGVMNDASGATFTTTFFSTDTTDKVNFRFHYSDNTSGSWSATVAGVPTPFAKTVTAATLTPTLALGLSDDHTTAIPGDTITYTAKVTNSGATLSVGGDFIASDTGSATTKVASYWDDVYTSLDGSSWSPLVGTAATSSGYTPTVPPPAASGLTLSLTNVAASGVTYPTSGDPMLGTNISSGSTAQWHYTATANLSSTQAASLFDPTKVKKIRNSFHLEVSPANPNVAQPAIVNLDFSNLFYGNGASASLSNVNVTIQPPQGAALKFNPTTTPALASLASGASASVSGTFQVPAAAAKAAGQTDAAYFAALAALEGSTLSATGSASATASTGTVNAPPPPAVTTVEHLPIVSITKTGPGTLNAGTTETNPLALSNSGGATASGLAITDAVPNGANGTVTGVPASLAPGATGNATATYLVPGTQAPGNLTDTASLTWQDANGNGYGPVSSSFTTNVANPFAGATLTLSPSSAGPNAPGTTQSLVATLLDSNQQPISGQTISFAVTGANPTSGSAVTDTIGNATFSYTGANVGTDVVQATFSAPGTSLTSNTSMVNWTKLLQPTATTIVQGNFFANPNNSCTFDIGSGATPVFGQTFPDILFNPDPSVVPHDISNINNFTRPFTDLTADVNGNYNGQIVAQGNGQQAGVGSLINFYAEFTGTFVVNQPGDLTFTINHDDGYIFGVGGGATRVNGDRNNDPLTTPFNGYNVMAGWNVSSTGSSSSGPATVHFPAAGTYPYELDYTECGGGALFLQLLSAQFTAQTSPLSIYVGYADGLRPGGSAFPFPWNGSPNTTFIGCTTCNVDAGALRFDNNSQGPMTFDSITVDIGSNHWDIWPHNQTLQAAQTLILTETVDDNFDTSDFSGSPCNVNNGVIPKVNVTIGGKTTTYSDTGQILNTGGFDLACLRNEDLPWTRIAGTGTKINVPTPPAATLDISPFNVQNALLGQTQTLTVSAMDGGGNPVANLAVKLQIFGPNAQTLNGTTTAAGQATFSYIGVVSGTDSTQASAFITGLRVISNQGTVVWSPPGGTGGPLPATITNASPADGTVVTTPVPISAGFTPPSGQTIASWQVTYQAISNGAVVTLASGTGTPPSTLATLDPTTLTDGNYQIGITAVASGGGAQTVNSSVTVIGNLKPGRYVTSYLDLAAQVAGVPMQVVRTYDSTDKSAGDFGIGWKVGLVNFRVSSNRTLGAGGWTQYNKSCTLGLCFTAFKNSTPRFVTVTYPDQHTEVFDFTPQGGTNVFWGCTPAFTARASLGTTSTLQPVDDTGCSYNGDGNIYGANGLYSPKQFRLTTKDGRVFVLDATAGLVSEADSFGNSITVSSGGIKSFLGPASNPTPGPSITFTRDGQGRITDVNGPLSSQQVQYAYYTNLNELQAVTDPNGNTDTYTYDPATGKLSSVTGPGGSPISALTYDSTGRLTSISTNGQAAVPITTDPGLHSQTFNDPNGKLTTVLTFDDLGDIVQKDEIVNGQPALTSRFQYDATGRMTDSVDAAGDETKFQYDESANAANGNILSVSQVNTNRTWAYQAYNSLGEPSQIVQPDGTPLLSLTYDTSTGALQSAQAPGQTPTTYSYFSNGELKSIVDPAGRQINYAYDSLGHVSSVGDGTNPPTQVSIDSAGLLRSVTDPSGNKLGYDYWPGGQLKSVTDARGGTWQYFYDGLGRLDHVIDPLQKTIQYHYNGQGQLDQVTDRNQQVTSYAYDVDGNLTRVTRPGNDVLNYVYDPRGHVISADDAAGHVDRVYDSLGRLKTETSCANTGSVMTPCPAPGTTGGSLPVVALSYQYWPDGQVKQMTSSDTGSTVNYTYDADGRLHTISDPANPSAGFTYSYDALGRTSGLQLPNGIANSYTYDPSGDLTGIQATLNGNPVASFDYQVDPVTGRWNQLTDASGPHVYGYNANGSLKSESNPTGSGLPTQTYGYDASGNRSTGSSISQYDAANRLVTDGAFNYQFDGEGNLLSKTPVGGGAGTTYLWNSDHQLKSITYPNGTTSNYEYDAFGRRVLSQDPNSTTAYSYAGLDVHADYNAQNQVQTSYLPQLESVTGGTASYYLTDGLGTVRDATNAGGTITGSSAYSAWGVPAPGNSTGNRYTFTGYQYDQTSGLYFAGSRYYDPSLGRFLSEDPLPANNSYTYAANDPVGTIDVQGQGPLIDYAEGLLNALNNAQCVAGVASAIATSAFSATMSALAGAHVTSDEALTAIGIGAGIAVAGCAANFPGGGGRGVQYNRLVGLALEDKVADELAQYGFTIIARRQYAWTGLGARVIDILAYRNGPDNVVAFEIKSGGSTYLSSQIAKDAWMARFGAVINGELTKPFPTILIRG